MLHALSCFLSRRPLFASACFCLPSPPRGWRGEDGHFVPFAPSHALHCMPSGVRTSPSLGLAAFSDATVDSFFKRNLVFRDESLRLNVEGGGRQTGLEGHLRTRRQSHAPKAPSPARCYAGLFGLAPPARHPSRLSLLSLRLPKPETATQAGSHAVQPTIRSAHTTRTHKTRQGRFRRHS